MYAPTETSPVCCCAVVGTWLAFKDKVGSVGHIQPVRAPDEADSISDQVRRGGMNINRFRSQVLLEGTWGCHSGCLLHDNYLNRWPVVFAIIECLIHKDVKRYEVMIKRSPRGNNPSVIVANVGVKISLQLG